VAIGVWQDASGTQQLQMQMLHSQRVELVGQLAAGVAHDFNNVLSAIGGFTSILLEDCPPEHPHHEDLAQIEALVARASGLAQNLLGFTRRRDVPRRYFVDVADALARLAPTLRILAGTRIQVVIDAPPLDVTVPVDPAMLDQVLLNLAANARDAMPDGGALHIGLRQSGDAARPRVTISVRDTGSGMSPEVLGRVFQPFFTTKPERRGTGLGLWLVREIVHGVGGRIELDSAPQRGTTVHLEFPAVDEPPSGDPDPRVRRTTQRDPSQRTCLLIEDEDAVRTVTRRILEHHGFRVLEAEASGQGLHILAAHRREIDVIVTDLHMPGLAGLPLIERLRSEAPEISCLVLTGLVDALRSVPPDPERLDVLSKPCDTPHLVARASQLATATQRRRAAA
jgi:two-component system cell cycle sensor histidine kinase/response regulator CckA